MERWRDIGEFSMAVSVYYFWAKWVEGKTFKTAVLQFWSRLPSAGVGRETSLHRLRRLECLRAR